jgi:hypothetical protein
MKSQLIKTNNTRKALLRDQSLQAVLKTWTPRMVDVGNKISSLPPQAGPDPMLAWGFLFALDALRYNEPALKALQEVVDELTERPTHQELFQMVDGLLAFKLEVKTLVKNQSQYRRLNRIRTSGPIRFRRGN